MRCEAACCGKWQRSLYYKTLEWQGNWYWRQTIIRLHWCSTYSWKVAYWKVNAAVQKCTHTKTWECLWTGGVFGTWRFKAHVYGGLQWEPRISQSLGKHFVWLINRIYRPLSVITWRAITDWRAPGDPSHLSQLHRARKQLNAYPVTLPLTPPPFLYPNTLVNSPPGLWTAIRISLICFKISHMKQIIAL